MGRYQVHIYSRALNILFDQFPTPSPDCFAKIAQAFLLSQGETMPSDFSTHFKTSERFKDDPDLFVFPEPILVEGSTASRDATKDVAIARCLRRQGILSEDQALILERRAMREVGMYGASFPFVHFIELSSWDKLKFLAWAQPTHATTDDFVVLVFRDDDSGDDTKKKPLKVRPRVTLSPLVCIHKLKTKEDEPPTDFVRVIRKHIEECLLQNTAGFRPGPIDLATRLGLKIDQQAQLDHLTRLFDNESELEQVFEQARPFARVFHPFFASAPHTDSGRIILHEADIDKRVLTASPDVLRKSIVKALTDLCTHGKESKQGNGKLEDFLETQTLALKLRHQDICFQNAKSWFALRHWTLAEKAAAYLRPPKLDIPPSEAVPHAKRLLTQDMALFACGQLPLAASWAVKSPKKPWPRLLVVRLDLDNVVTDYYENWFLPARRRLASDKEHEESDPDQQDRWRHHYVRVDDAVHITDFHEQDLFLDHVAIVTNVPKVAVRACLDEIVDTSLEYAVS